jgi:hypothetical protein
VVRFCSKLTGVRSATWATRPCEVYEWPSRSSAAQGIESPIEAGHRGFD